MKKILSSFVLSTALLAVNMGSLSLATPLYAEEEVTTVSHSFMSDKTEIAVDLEVSGAEALCQTDDGFVWIGQYSGLTRYDSDEYVTYKSFNENGTEYSIINIRGLAADQNTLYVATHKNIFVYKDYQFSYVDIDAGVIKGIVLDEDNDFLEIWEEFEKAETEEAKFIKNIDKLEFLLQACAYGHDVKYYERSLNEITDKYCKEIALSAVEASKGNIKPNVIG